MAFEDLKIGELHDEAKRVGIKGQSTMRKQELIDALTEHAEAEAEPEPEREPVERIPRATVGAPSAAAPARPRQMRINQLQVTDQLRSLKQQIRELMTQVQTLERALRIDDSQEPAAFPEEAA